MRRVPGFGAATALGLRIEGFGVRPDRHHAERGQLDAGEAKAGALAVDRLVGFLEQLDEFPRRLGRDRTIRHRHHQIVGLAAVAHVDRARELAIARA